MGFRIDKGIFQVKDTATNAFVNKFKFDKDAGRIVEVDGEGNARDSYLKSGEKAADSNLLDGIDSGAFIRSNDSDNVTGHTEWQDGYNIRLGNGADFRMWFDGNHMVFRNYNHAAGNIYFQGENTSGTNNGLLYLITDTARSYVKLYENGGEKLRTVSDGIRVYGSARINGSTNNGRLYADDWGVKVGTDAGHIQIGPANTSWAHIYTDRPAFYTNKAIYENGSRLATQSYAVGQKNAAITHADSRIDGEAIPAADAALAEAGKALTAAQAAQTTANGKANANHDHDRLYISDTRGAKRTPSYYNDRYAQWDFQHQGDTGAGGRSWHTIQTISKWSTYDYNHPQEQIVFTGDSVKRRVASNDATWGGWITMLDTSNFNPNNYPEFIGPKGDKGDTGAAGAKGDKGDTGDRGPAGAAGAAGPQGPKGDTGSRGPAGAAGAQGPKGDTGARGATGSRGPAGPAGPAGANGVAPAQIDGANVGTVTAINFNMRAGVVEFHLSNGERFSARLG